MAQTTRSTAQGRRSFSAARASTRANRVLRNAQSLIRKSSEHRDAALIGAAGDYGVIHRRIGRLLQGSGRIEAESVRSRRFADLTEAAAPLLEQLGNARAVTNDGHKARAAAFLAWNEGEIMGRADRDGLLEDRLLAAILLDLAEL